MKRYSNLYGTIYAGNSNVAVYASVGSSKLLPEFLNEIGAVNTQLTVDTVRNILAGFPDTEEYKRHYSTQPQNDLPVSVRYAPMHLRNHPNMPSSIKPFSAIGISGNENKKNEGDTRYSTYVQTIYIGREHMHKAVAEKVSGETRTYNYLDQIFGSIARPKPLDHMSVAAIRGGKDKSNPYDALPNKIEPKLQPWDRNVVYNTVDAVFDNKTVVIRLEKGCAFNARAWELLIPIYALMPPRLATEIGFATYLLPSEIRKLAADTSMRIFVLPADCSLDAVAGSDVLIMDLSAAAPVRGLASEEMGKILNGWEKMLWDKRQSAMEMLFNDTAISFNDKSAFMQCSAEFLNSAAVWDKRAWLERGAFSTLEELKAKYDSLPLCARIPWMKSEFISRVPAMMAEKGLIHKLTGQALAQWRLGADESVKAHAKEMYEFGREMGGTNPLAMADSAGKLVRTQTLEEEAPKLAAEKERTAQAVAAGQAAVAAEKENTAKAIEAGKAATAKAKAEGEAAVAQAKAEGEAAVAQTKADSEAAMAAAVAAEQAKTEQVKQAAAAKIKSERDAHQATQQQLEAEQAAHQATRAEAAGYKSQIDTAKAEAAQAVSAARKKQSEAEAAKSDADKARADAEAARAKADKTIQENNKRMVIFAAAGFLVAALIFGVIMLVMGLGGDKDAEPSTEPSASAEMTTEATEPSTEETTEATEETTEPSEPEIPDLTVWTDDTAALWLTEQYPGISEITLEPTDIPEELETIEGYTAVALIRMADEESYAVLMSAAGDVPADVEMVPMEDNTTPTDETEEPTDSTDPTDETEEPTDSTDPTDGTGEPTDSTEPEDPTGETEEPTETAPVAVQVEGASLVLTSQDFLLVVYGGDDAMETAIEVFAAMLETEPVATSWNVGETPWNLDTLLGQLLKDDQWWRTVNTVSTYADDLTQGQTLLSTDDAPVLCLNCDGTLVFVHEELMSLQAKDLAEELTEAGHTAVAEETLVAVIPGE